MSQNSPIRWWSSPRTVLRHLLMLDDTAHSIALGTAVGMFFGMTPTVGVQMGLVVLFGLLTRRLFRFNQIAGLVTVYVSNPITIVPIYWFDYKVGTLFFDETVSYKRFAAMLEYEGLAEWWRMLVSLFVDVGAPLIVGSLIVASISAAVTYPVMRILLRTVRPERREQRRMPQRKRVASLAE